MESSRFFVANLPVNTTEKDLQYLFQDYGQIKNIELKTKESLVDPNDIRVIAFVTLNVGKEDAQYCLNDLNWQKIHGQNIKVSLAKESFLERLKREREEAKSGNDGASTFHESKQSLEQPSDLLNVPKENKRKTFDVNAELDDDEVAPELMITKKRAASSMHNGKIVIQAHDVEPIHVIENKHKKKNTLDTKSNSADQKRKESLNKMKNQYEQKKNAIQQALQEMVKFKVPLPSGVNSSTLLPKLIRTKDVKQLQDGNAQPSKPKLTKCLNTLDLTSLGIGSCCGTGMYLVAGMVAKNIAGPGVIISFIIAAIASIFSGACYAEFGVRVPHTSGSAYMYSYVAVGEFVAFIIGWNMILEYLIGTSACACALSSSFDSLTGGAISTTIGDTIGTIFGKPPDFIAFGITLIMTSVLAMGASKSVIFNHALNAINLATWVFVMTAGLFYVDTNTWIEHQGFLPYGWSGVFSGAATCFYAFIGFDIIATTGEEAHNPQKSIPKAIVGSLVIVLLAYVTVSLVLTLVVPYDHINSGAALVQMWSYVNAPKCRAIVAIGATAGLSVAMFGSMFPMPRVIYAMAQDGLIFKQLSQLWQRTNVPGLATIGSGIAAALVALSVRLEILVEMMSIGTLLAYTLVSTCVLVLRYQPHSTSLIELLPAQLRTPITAGATNDPHKTTAEVLESNKLTIKRVTRGMSDSDDSFIDESPDGFLGRDDQFLVSDRSENKFYGAVHGAPTGPTGQATAFDTMGLNFISRKLHEYSYLCPGFFPWINPGQATSESGMYVTKLVGIMFGLIFFLDLFAAIGWSGGFAAFIYFILFIGIFVILLIISRQPQNRYALAFLTPGLPFIPAIAIAVNIYLIFKLSILTLVRFTIWMSLGLVMYFYYGITHSTLEQATDDMELRVDKDYSKNVEEKAVWDQPSYRNQNHEPVWASKDNTKENTTKPRSNPSYKTQENNSSNTHHTTSARNPAIGQTSGNTGTFSMFVDETQFPSWDD